jgi:hypothetical protein
MISLPLIFIRIEGRSPSWDGVSWNTRLPPPGHDLHTFHRQHGPAQSLAFFGDSMTTVKRRASTILNAFGDVQSELIGKAVVLTDGKAGTVENVWLDELHGMRISIRGHDGKWPISTIKFEQATRKP